MQDLQQQIQTRRHHRIQEQSESNGELIGIQEEIKRLKERLDNMEKGLIDLLVGESKLPLTKKILESPLPPKFKMLQIKPSSGQGDPTEHLETFRSWMEL